MAAIILDLTMEVEELAKALYGVTGRNNYPIATIEHYIAHTPINDAKLKLLLGYLLEEYCLTNDINNFQRIVHNYQPDPLVLGQALACAIKSAALFSIAPDYAIIRYVLTQNISLLARDRVTNDSILMLMVENDRFIESQLFTQFLDKLHMANMLAQALIDEHNNHLGQAITPLQLIERKYPHILSLLAKLRPEQLAQLAPLAVTYGLVNTLEQVLANTRTYIHRAQLLVQLITQAIMQDSITLGTLIANGALQTRYKELPQEDSALVLAIKYNSLQAIDAILRFNLDSVAFYDKDNRSAISYAAEFGHAHIITILADSYHSLEIDSIAFHILEALKSRATSNGFNALYFAVQNQHPEAVAVILNIAQRFGAHELGNILSLNENDSILLSPSCLLLAVANGDIATLTLLLQASRRLNDRGLQLLDATDSSGKSPLLLAASRGDSACYQAILAYITTYLPAHALSYYQQVDDYNNNIPLLAAFHNKPEIMALFLEDNLLSSEQTYNLLSAANAQFMTPLLLAASNQASDIIVMLAKYFSPHPQQWQSMLQQRDSSGRVPQQLTSDKAIKELLTINSQPLLFNVPSEHNNHASYKP